MNLIVFMFLIILQLGALTTSIAEGSEQILYKFSGKTLKDSKWGPITYFQEELSRCLESCGKQKLEANGVFGLRTKEALLELMSCPSYSDLAISSTDPLYGVVDEKIWKKLLPKHPLPTVHQRAFAIVLTHENTDYDRVEWNYGTADDKSALTWGPYGATVGWGNEVRSILQILHSKNRQQLKDAFGKEFPTVEVLITSVPKEGYNILKNVYIDKSRKKAWKKALQSLGGTEYGRNAYDKYALGSNSWLRPSLKLLYSLMPKDDATEIDYAFFLDLSAHTSVAGKISGAKSAIINERNNLKRPLKNFERRRIIGEYFASKVSKNWENDRRGRNVVFYIDAIPTEKLSKVEAEAWKKRSGRIASDFGLSDDRKYYPGFLHKT